MADGPVFVSSSADTREDWGKARRSAFVQDVLSAVSGRSGGLLPFEEVRRKMNLRNSRYIGLQDVPLEKIVGSVDRYQDFTRAFFPKREAMGSRWQRVDALMNSATGLGPVELYKVGEAYFVRDGNHRVSVARMHDFPSIQAYVWEYDVRVPLESDSDMDDVLLKAAYGSFLQRTHIDAVCPDVDVHLTQPDGYDELLYEIEEFRRIIADLDEREVSFEEGVELWCEMRYQPIVEIIRERDVLAEFPERTETDLYLFMKRSLDELQIRYGSERMASRSAEEMVEELEQRPSTAQRVRRAVGQLAEGVGELGGRLVESITPSDGVNEARRDALLSFMCPILDRVPPCRFRGTTAEAWEAWQREFRQHLWEVLGVSLDPMADWEAWDLERLDPVVEEDEEVDGLRRQLTWIHVGDRLWVPAYLFTHPGVDGPRPTILVFPGHGTIDQAAGLQRSYQRANARSLARAGYVVLAMELRGFGILDAVGHLRIDAAARLVGRSWYGLLVQDAMRMVDYLRTRPEVDVTRIGAAGIGAGGALAMYLAALDQRVAAAVVNSYLGKYLVTCIAEEHCPCNDIAGLRRCAEMGDVASLIAPRPVLFVNGLRDPATSQVSHESFGIVRQSYRLLGIPNRAKLLEPEGLGHAFDNELAIGWFRRWLGAVPAVGEAPSSK